MAKQKEKNYLKIFDQFFKTNQSCSDPLLRKLIYDSKLIPNLSPLNPLSAQETICLILLTQGLNPDKCAELLHISSATVRTYEQRVREKLNASHRLNAFYKALDAEYILFCKQQS